MTRRTRLAAAVASGAAALSLTAAPAQAYSPDPDERAWTKHSSGCPCWEWDPADGTHVKHDSGGIARKTELWYKGRMVGKFEFHPYNEELWVYDTSNDGDRLYFRFSYKMSNGNTMRGAAYPPATGNRLDKRRLDLNIPEGNWITIDIFDRNYSGDYIGMGMGRA